MNKYPEKQNDYLEHYLKHNISPVRQDISDTAKHFLKRKALYRTLGLLPSNFMEMKILEVGPGSGYNSIVIARWGAAKYFLIEPNPTGISHIRELFRKYKVDPKRVQIINTLLEDFRTKEKFDIVICEAMIPGLNNKEKILTKLDSLLKKDGVMILTCTDEISIFFELIRYFFANRLTKDINDFKKKIKILVSAFRSHLQTLRGLNRLEEDWCADSLMGKSIFNNDFSLKRCLGFFKDNYFMYHTSPQFFEDFRWYKALPQGPRLFNQNFIDQFDLKMHNLLHYKVVLEDRSKEKNEELLALCRQSLKVIRDTIQPGEKHPEEKLIYICDLMIGNLKNTNKILLNSIKEVKEILKKQDYSVDAISTKYRHFISAFGRGQQYISLIKA